MFEDREWFVPETLPCIYLKENKVSEFDPIILDILSTDITLASENRNPDDGKWDTRITSSFFKRRVYL